MSGRMRLVGTLAFIISAGIFAGRNIYIQMVEAQGPYPSTVATLPARCNNGEQFYLVIPRGTNVPGIYTCGLNSVITLTTPIGGGSTPGPAGPQGPPGPASITLHAGYGVASVPCSGSDCTINLDPTVVGPPGPTGPQGIQGPIGPAGGPTGPTGPTGPAGANGIGFIAYFAGVGDSTNTTTANHILNSFAIPAATLVNGVTLKADLTFTHLTSSGGTCSGCTSTPRIQLALCGTNIGSGTALPSTTDDWAFWRPRIIMTGAATESSIYMGWRSNGSTVQTSTIIANSIDPSAGCNLDVQGWFNANGTDVLQLLSYEIWLVKNP